MKTKTLMTTIFGLALLLAAQSAFAFDNFPTRIPNGNLLSQPASCINCHDSDGPPLNPFGNAFVNAGSSWSAALAALDSDGDGFSNGKELGDPAGTWVEGNPNPPGPVFYPGDAASHPTVVATPLTIQSPSVSGTNFTLRVNSQAGFNYVLEATPLLVPATWTGIQTNAGGGTLTFTTPVNPATSKLYFRIRVQ